MPEVEAVDTICAVSPSPRPRPSELDTEAGASMAWVGTAVPSGSVVSVWCTPATLATGALAPATDAVNAADSMASGTRAVALRRRPLRRSDTDFSRLCSLMPPPEHPGRLNDPCSLQVTETNVVVRDERRGRRHRSDGPNPQT